MKENELFELVMYKVKVKGKHWVQAAQEVGIRSDEIGPFIEDVKAWFAWHGMPEFSKEPWERVSGEL